MDNKVTILLVGINGYGDHYLKEILFNNQKAHLAGVVDINPEKSDNYDEVISRKIPIYNNIEEFYQLHTAELAIISTPIHLHREQSCYAMNQGSHVLCEKPMTSDPKDIEVMIETRDRTGKFLGIGFNWSFTSSVLQLKEDILKGDFGKPLCLKAMVQWPRNEAYYSRSSWSGKKYSSGEKMIYDSVANNAAAHFLHHLLYIVGDQLDTSAQLDSVTAELYRTNAIETFDTCAVKLTTTNNVDLYYYATHAVKEDTSPIFTLEFENATITYDPNQGTSDMIAIWKDGSRKTYTDPDKNHLVKLDVCIDAIQSGNYQIPCGPEAASAHVQSIQAMHESVPNSATFPEQLVHYEENEKMYWVQGLADDLTDCYNNWSLPSDLNLDWSIRGKTIKINN